MYFTRGQPDRHSFLVEAFNQALRELGYVEGQGIILERRYGDSKL